MNFVVKVEVFLYFVKITRFYFLSFLLLFSNCRLVVPSGFNCSLASKGLLAFDFNPFIKSVLGVVILSIIVILYISYIVIIKKIMIVGDVNEQ